MISQELPVVFPPCCVSLQYNEPALLLLRKHTVSSSELGKYFFLQPAANHPPPTTARGGHSLMYANNVAAANKYPHRIGTHVEL